MERRAWLRTARLIEYYRADHAITDPDRALGLLDANPVDAALQIQAVQTLATLRGRMARLRDARQAISVAPPSMEPQVPVGTEHQLREPHTGWEIDGP